MPSLSAQGKPVRMIFGSRQVRVVRRVLVLHRSKAICEKGKPFYVEAEAVARPRRHQWAEPHRRPTSKILPSDSPALDKEERRTCPPSPLLVRFHYRLRYSLVYGAWSTRPQATKWPGERGNP